FDSAAANLTGGKCDNGFNHVFVRDRTAGTTTCVSVNSNGKQGNQNSHAPAISSDGRFVAFDSAATNLTGGKCDNGFNHIFVRDRSAGTTTCVSVHSNGAEGNGDSFEPSISSDGQIVVFQSSATNLTTRCTNGNSHVYVHDLTTGQTKCLSVDSHGDESDGNSSLAKISGDGLFVAFQSDATNLTSRCNNAFMQIFIRDLTNDKMPCASVDNNGNQGNNDSVQPSISSDGQSVAYSSVATNLTATRCITGNNQIFVRDQTAKKTTCASVNSKKIEGNGDSANPSISGNGNVVAFESISNNLVKKDTNGILDVFADDLP
ncbi:MAG: TolB family protein, partial [Deltaproteobacteria bacterium]